MIRVKNLRMLQGPVLLMKLLVKLQCNGGGNKPSNGSMNSVMSQHD